MLKTISTGLIALGLSVSSLSAAQWQMRESESSLALIGQIGQSEQPAAFKSFKADITFDPADLPSSSVRVVIDLASVETGDDQYDADLKTKSWFAVKAAPEAVFVADTITATGDGAYEAKGSLELKGVTVPVQLPFTLTIEKGVAVMDGETSVNRIDFGIGQSTEEKWVAAAVKVKVHVVADEVAQ